MRGAYGQYEIITSAATILLRMLNILDRFLLCKVACAPLCTKVAASAATVWIGRRMRALKDLLGTHEPMSMLSYHWTKQRGKCHYQQANTGAWMMCTPPPTRGAGGKQVHDAFGGLSTCKPSTHRSPRVTSGADYIANPCLHMPVMTFRGSVFLSMVSKSCVYVASIVACPCSLGIVVL